jgi:hypothetical protein
MGCTFYTNDESTCISVLGSFTVHGLYSLHWRGVLVPLQSCTPYDEEYLYRYRVVLPILTRSTVPLQSCTPYTDERSTGPLQSFTSSYDEENCTVTELYSLYWRGVLHRYRVVLPKLKRSTVPVPLQSCILCTGEEYLCSLYWQDALRQSTVVSLAASFDPAAVFLQWALL